MHPCATFGWSAVKLPGGHVPLFSRLFAQGSLLTPLSFPLFCPQELLFSLDTELTFAEFLDGVWRVVSDWTSQDPTLLLAVRLAAVLGGAPWGWAGYFHVCLGNAYLMCSPASVLGRSPASAASALPWTPPSLLRAKSSASSFATLGDERNTFVSPVVLSLCRRRRPRGGWGGGGRGAQRRGRAGRRPQLAQRRGRGRWR
jgi:hypothetical protein